MSSIITRTGIVLAGALLLLSIGCSKERTPKVLINPDTGKHPAQWATPDVHGAAAKGAASSTTGFAVCQECHNSDYSGGISRISCLNMAGCHGAGVMSPHAPIPWRSGPRTHVNTDQSNAPVCAQCHTNGANAPVRPSPFDPAAAPGCFNNTLCHGVVGHPAGWALPTAHGATAKSAPSPTAGFSSCQICHGNDFTGGLALQTCLNTAGCHGAGVYSPHAKPWLPGSTYTHTTTDEGNAPVCALCHANGMNSPIAPPSPPAAAGTSPGCFNNTLCHGQGHPAGWALPTAHGAAAKAAPSSTAGFSSCQNCHGNDFTGGVAMQTCLNTDGCHGVGVNSPHAAAWLPGNTYTHITTDQGNAPVCARCHANGLNSTIAPPSPPATAGTTPGCFNGTLCHYVPGHANSAAWSLYSGHGASAKAAPNVATTSGFSTCQICHGPDFTGGISNITCYLCHPTAPHAPTPWLIDLPGSLGVLSHVSTNPSNAPVCALCHLGNRTPPSYVTIPAGAQPDCFNSTLCHAIPTSCFNCHTSPPSGSTAPNQDGSHKRLMPDGLVAGHNALPNVTGACDPCHSGAGIGTPKHNNGTVDVAFKNDYNAKSGPAAYDATGFTCSNVSCHGGQTTPNWLTGTIDVNTQCTSCHSYGITQYNSYNSGQHWVHTVDEHFACYTCHDTIQLAVNHFTSLNTIAMEGPASATIAASLNYNGVTCEPSCHDLRTW
jgi:predicted CxxxxCH...CXXCH cytochrome family protein